MKRRKFIKSMSRNLMAGAIIAGGGYLLLKEKSEEEPNFEFICKNCKQLSKCSLQEARDFKNKEQQKRG